jgi:hypothetical protein
MGQGDDLPEHPGTKTRYFPFPRFAELVRVRTFSSEADHLCGLI